MRSLIFVLSLFVSACATSPAAPINAPLGGLRADVEGRAPVGEDLIVLALSGGGARAASFHLGVLQGLRAMPGRDGRPLTEHIALISSVSGGSVLAAHYGLVRGGKVRATAEPELETRKSMGYKVLIYFLVFKRLQKYVLLRLYYR